MRWLEDKIYSLTPAWLCRFVSWVMERPKYIRWWFIRAQGKLPVCDCWEFNATLARTIIQGVDYLLNGCTDWDNKTNQQEKEDLIYIKGVMQSFLELHSSDEQYRMGEEEWDSHEQALIKAFSLLGKWMWKLWD